ncbi:MAG: glycosyltransferase [Flavobacteriales bacterium]|nr:glycosyltransferase [Flavobacteriales bacterium]
MLENFLQWDSLSIFWLALFTTAWLIQMFYWLYFLLRVSRHRDRKISTSHEPPVSVVISAKNEERSLMEHLPHIMNQDYKNFEVVVVNDSSWDDTQTVLKALSLKYSNLHVVNLDEEKQSMGGKKFALTLGIKAAKHDLILLTDADCIPASNQWLRKMTGALGEKKQIVLGFSPYAKHKGLLNQLIRFDAWMIGMQYFGFAKAGIPYMGVGRNLAYNKELFFRMGGFRAHYHLASGDDDLFVNHAANDRNTVVQLSPLSHTISEPKKTWGSWFTQKRRHFTTAPRYRPLHKKLLALWPLSFVMMLAGFAGSMAMQRMMLVLAAMLFIRYATQIAILHRASKRMNQQDLLWYAPLLELQLIFIQVWLYASNLVLKPQKWN